MSQLVDFLFNHMCVCLFLPNSHDFLLRKWTATALDKLVPILILLLLVVLLHHQRLPLLLVKPAHLPVMQGLRRHQLRLHRARTSVRGARAIAARILWAETKPSGWGRLSRRGRVKAVVVLLPVRILLVVRVGLVLGLQLIFS